jgi:diguanylate cyclase (GGDEF)-like protein/PAS domain S-box-containing protein
MMANFFNPVLLRQRGLTLMRWAVFAVSYFLAAAFGAILIPTIAIIPFVWPASGFALGVLLISKKRDWAAIVLIIFAGTLAAMLVTGRGLASGVGFSLVTCIQSLASAWLLVGALGPSIQFNRLKEVIYLICITILIAMLAGVGGAFVSSGNSNISFGEAWFLWALTSEVSAILVAPFILTWRIVRLPPRALSAGMWVETILFIITLILFSGYAFINASITTRFLTILPYFIFPVLFWAALRFGPHGASGAMLVVSAFTIGGTLIERGAFALTAQSVNEQIIAVQAFLGVSAISAYLAAAIFSERKEAERALRESEERMRLTLIHTPVIFTQLDRDGNVIYQNRNTGSSKPSTDETNLFEGISAETQVELSDAIVKTFETGMSQQVEVGSTDEIGNTFWYDVRFGPIMAEGEVSSVTKIAIDITDRKRAEAALRLSEERYSLAARGANDGIWDWDLQTNRIYYSQRWKQMLGYSEGSISVSPDEWLGRIHPEDVKYVREDIATYLRGSIPQLISEHRIMHHNGSYRWFLVRGVSVSKDGGKSNRLAGSMTDITARMVTEERLRHDSMHDLLTNLSNRIYFTSQLQRTIDLSRRHGEYMAAILFIDVDRFKVINESLGHSSGDQLLVNIARRLETCIRPEDTVARFGGDEFCILLEEIKGINDATRVANRVQEKLFEPFDLQGNEVVVTASIGINLVTIGYDRAEDLIRDAEMAMYGAKSNGRARYQIFDKEMHAHSLAMFKLEAELRGAEERHEFQIYYQPIYSSNTGVVTCVEALLRWIHPERGLIYPDFFIPLAEEIGVIVPLGEWVLRQACKQICEWREMGMPGMRVAVNISARQLQDPNFPVVVKSALADSSVPGTCLQLEITESAAMQDFNMSVNALNELIQLGVRISLDDLGMRYSSLDYLKRFPIDTIKIDKSFVWDITDNPDDAAIASAIISVAHILKLNVVGEGVETKQQLEFLLRNNCDEIQGHFYSQAQSGADITLLLKAKAAESRQNDPE